MNRRATLARKSPDEVRLRLVAAGIAIAALVLVAVSVGLLLIEVARGWLPIDEPGLAQILIAVAIFALSFPLLGWVILRRLPTNRLGWIYLAIGSWQALNMFASAYSTLAFWVATGNLPLASTLSWVAVWAWVPGFTLFSTLGILLFPSGHLPSRRWSPVLVLAGFAFGLLLVPAVVMWSYQGLPLERMSALNIAPPANPGVDLAYGIAGVGQVVLLIAMVGSVAGLAARFRHSRGVERQQLKWFTYGAILDVLLLVIWTADLLNPPLSALSALLFALLPIAIAIAILRYRLFEIDRIISRTISWAAITAILGASFVLAIFIAQTLIAPIAGSNALVVAGSTLLVAALFQPVRGRVQRIVDRRFNRTRYDAERTVARFAVRLRDEVDLEALRAEILATVSAAVEPRSLSLWLRE